MWFKTFMRFFTQNVSNSGAIFIAFVYHVNCARVKLYIARVVMYKYEKTSVQYDII